MHTSSNIVNIVVPKSWQELSEKQLKFLYNLLLKAYSLVEVKTLCLFKWGNLKVRHRVDGGYIVSCYKQEFFLSSGLVASMIEELDWIGELPNSPVRFSRIKGSKAIDARFEGVAFEKYIICDNLYNGYLHSRSDELLLDLCASMYDSHRIKPSKLELISVFYWFSSLKALFSKTFPNFFQPAQKNNDNLLNDNGNATSIIDAMNAQIRALTDGDITKEKTVLQMDTWRALTELEAKAKDYEHHKELMAKYGK